MDPRLKQEIDILTEIYCDELELRPSQNFVKLRVKCLPLLEDRNIEHHYEFDHPFLFANIDVPNEYPDDSPKFYLESTHSKIAIGTSLAELTIRVENLAKTMQGDPCIVDMIEYIRKNKHFKKRRHLMSDDPSYFYYDDDEDDKEENLIKKSQFTEVTAERFAAWLTAFRAEAKMKQEKDPLFIRKKAVLLKPSGRMIFNDRTKDLANYYDDDKNEDDDEDIDLKKEMVEGEDEGGEEEQIDIDEDVFGDEDDLDDEDFIVDDN